MWEAALWRRGTPPPPAFIDQVYRKAQVPVDGTEHVQFATSYFTGLASASAERKEAVPTLDFGTTFALTHMARGSLLKVCYEALEAAGVRSESIEVPENHSFVIPMKHLHGERRWNLSRQGFNLLEKGLEEKKPIEVRAKIG